MLKSVRSVARDATAKPPIIIHVGESALLKVPESLFPEEGLEAEPPGDIPFDEGDSPGDATGTPIAEQALSGGVVTPQTEGSISALLTLICIPKLFEFLSSSQRQIGWLSTSPANSGQHPLSGFVRLLWAST